MRSLAAWIVVVSAAVLAVAGIAGAAPANRVFTVANYPVDAKAKDAVTAKEKAHAEGQQAAFRSLLKRLVPVTAYNRMERLKAVNSADLVDGVAVRSERNSSTTYIASLDFSFEADAVRDLLRRESVPFIDTQAPQVILVPVARDPASETNAGAGGQGELRPAGGEWNEVWKGLDLENTLTPLRLEALRPTVHSDAIASLLAGDDNAGRILEGEYRTPYVIVAAGEVDKPGARLHVTIAGRDAVGPLVWKRSYRLAGGDVGFAMELAAVVTLGVLEGRWKAAKSEGWGGVDALAGPGSEIRIEAEFSSLAEWNEMRRHLLETDGVGDLRIGAVSARGAEMSLRYPGGGESLANALARQGLSLRSGGAAWILRASF
jgi:hypothetical protein